MGKKRLVLVQDEVTGCITPVTHKLNHDGYFRKNMGNGNVMYHVYVYEKYHGKVPDGYEVHHKCGNRACCNIDHLEAIEGHKHTIQGNKERYKSRYKAAFLFWKEHHCTGTQLGEKFGVTFSCGCRWIRTWKKESAETISQESRNFGVIPKNSEAHSTVTHIL